MKSSHTFVRALFEQQFIPALAIPLADCNIKIKNLNKLSVILVLLLINLFSIAQNNLEFTFDITFGTNVISVNSDDDFPGPTYKFRLEKYESSCKFGEITYSFQKKDTLLLRYFSDFKKLFEQPDFYRNFNKTCPELWSHKMHLDGIQTNFWYKSDSTNISIGADDGICNFNSLYDNILDNFFNIAIYISNQPSSKGKFLDSRLPKLKYLESATGFAPIKLVTQNPLTYRLKGRTYERSYTEVLNILNGLPKDKPTCIEVGGNFYVNEYDSFYHYFKEFLKEPNKIIWFPENKSIADELRKLGVDKKSIKKP